MNKILILSNMYPNTTNPEYGIFVKNFVDQIKILKIPYEKVVMSKTKNRFRKIINYIIFFSKAIFKMLFGDYKAIYVHYPSISGIPVIFVSLFKNIIIYTNVHGTDVLPVSNLEKKLVKNTSKLLNNSEKIIVPSNYYKNIIVEDFKIENPNIYIYPSGGIDSEIFYPIENLNVESNKFTFGFVGRIIKTKGWKVFTEALKKIEQEYIDIDIKIIVIGEGKDYDDLLSQLNELELFLEVELVPFVNQERLNEYYNEFDALIFPTFKESLGLVALEAMFTGTPVIASDISPLNNYINHQSNGVLFKKGSSIDLKNKMIDFINAKERKKKDMGIRAFKSSRIYSKEHAENTLKNIFN